MNVQLPEIFMALAFPEKQSAKRGGGSENNPKLRDDDLEACRIATVEYLLPKLQSKYPRLSQVNIKYLDLEWGTGKPETRFQAYWKADISMQFAATKEDKASQTEPVPRPMVLFESAGELFRREFYLEFLREHPRVRAQQQSSSSSAAAAASRSLLTTATDVQVGLIPQSTEGGAVKAPNFYMGFVCVPPPTKKPSAEQLQRLRDYSYTRMLRCVRKAYEGMFDEDEGMTLEVVKSEINQDAGKPVDTFNLYVEFEAIGIFVKNAPPPMQFYAELASFSLDEFLPGVVGMGGCLDRANQMAINPCAWIEDLHVDTRDPMSLGDLVPVHVEFWLALVIPDAKETPNGQQTKIFDEMMQEFLRKTMVAAYGSYNFHSIDLQRESCEFQAKVPLPRFNILHRYKADISFANPIPVPPHVLSKVMRCDVGTLIGKISTLPAPWSGTMEGTLGSAMFQKPSEEKVYEGRMSDKAIVVPVAVPKLPAPQPPKKPEAPKVVVPIKPPTLPSPPPPKKPEAPPPKVVIPKPSPPPPTPTPPKKPEVKPEPCVSKTAPAPKKPVVVTPTPSPATLVPTPSTTKVPAAPVPAPKKEQPAPPVVKPAPAVPAPPRKPLPVVSKPTPKPEPPKTAPPAAAAAQPARKESSSSATPAPPSPSMETPKANVDDSIVEHWAEIFVALTIAQDDKPTTEPTPDEYEKLAKATKSFYTKFLSKRYGKDTFQSISVSVRATKYNAGIPAPQYNVYVEWDIHAHFFTGGGAGNNSNNNNNNNNKAPSRLEFCAALASEIDMLAYLKDRIRILTNTPFENAVAIYTEQVNSLKK